MMLLLLRTAVVRDVLVRDVSVGLSEQSVPPLPKDPS